MGGWLLERYKNQIALFENEFHLYGSVLMSRVQICGCIERTTFHYFHCSYNNRDVCRLPTCSSRRIFPFLIFIS